MMTRINAFIRVNSNKNMTEHNIVIGSRESRLAVIQSEMVMDYIKNQCLEYEPELVTMKVVQCEH